MVAITKLMVKIFYLVLPEASFMWWLFSTLLDVDAVKVIVSIHHLLSMMSLFMTFCYLYKSLGHLSHLHDSLYIPKLKSIINLCLETTVTNQHLLQYKLTVVILNISSHRLFRPFRIGKDENDKKNLFKTITCK